MNRESIIAAGPFHPARKAELRGGLNLALAGRVFGPAQWRCVRGRIGAVGSPLRRYGGNPEAAQNSTRRLVRRTFLPLEDSRADEGARRRYPLQSENSVGRV